MKVHSHENFAEVIELYKGHNFYFNTTKADQHYSDIQFKADDFLVFGKETAGLPEQLLTEHKENCIRIPMVSDARSLNLSNSAAIVVYEALRQQQFVGLK